MKELFRLVKPSVALLAYRLLQSRYGGRAHKRFDADHKKRIRVLSYQKKKSQARHWRKWKKR